MEVDLKGLLPEELRQEYEKAIERKLVSILFEKGAINVKTYENIKKNFFSN